MSAAPAALAGRGVAITRAEAAPGPLERRLLARGARVLRWTAVAFAPPADPQPLAEALTGIERFDWVVFASAHAVEVVLEGLPHQPAALRVAAAGSATAEVLERAGWRVDCVPEVFGAAGLLAALSAVDLAAIRVLLPASAVGRDELAAGLAARGARIERVEAYRTLPAALDAAACHAALAAREVDAVTFASPSAVEGLAQALGGPAMTALAAAAALIAIGPTTSQALVARGLPVAAEATPSTLGGLVAAVERALAAPRRAHRTATGSSTLHSMRPPHSRG